MVGLCSLPLVWPQYGRGNGNLLQKDLCQGCCIQCPWTHGRPMSTHAYTGDYWTLTGKSVLVSCGVTAPFFWVLMHTRFCFWSPRVCFPSPVIKSHWLQSQILWRFSVPLPDHQVGKSLVGPKTFTTVQELLWYNCQSVGCLLSGSMVGLTCRASQVCCSESTIPVTGQCWPAPQQETLKHSKAGLAQSLVGPLGPGVHKVLFEPSEHLWRAWGLILNVISALLLSCWDFSFALGCGVSFFGGIQHSPVNGYSMVSCNFGVLTGEDESMSFYSATWKTQQWPQDRKKSVFIPIPKKGNAKECSNYHTTALTSHASKIMLKILQDRLQQYVNRETPDVQTGFRKAFKKDFKKADIKLPISIG